jgi:hypothetical protein
MKMQNPKFNKMKTKSLKSVLIIILLLVFSCDEPETIVTNIIYPDGSVTRRIEMRNQENRFEISKIQVPFDSTWSVRDSIELDSKKDTIWVRRAEKHFKSVDEINNCYRADSGSNKEVKRRTEFSKKFKWFNTEYRFAEIIDKKLAYGYPLSQFLNKEELSYFYSPESIVSNKKNGPDSLRYRAFEDTINRKVEKWTAKCLVSEWIGQFAKLTEGKAGKDLSIEMLKKREEEFVKMVEVNSEKFDSLWKNGIVLKQFLGEENAIRFKKEADSTIDIVTDSFWLNFHNYSVRIVMPGKVIATNGFIDSTQMLLWPVHSEYFIAEPYEMWAESKVPNTWAWIISGLFVLFVITGLVVRLRRR